jgi:hypothetical protein
MPRGARAIIGEGGREGKLEGGAEGDGGGVGGCWAAAAAAAAVAAAAACRQRCPAGASFMPQDDGPPPHGFEKKEPKVADKNALYRGGKIKGLGLSFTVLSGKM